MDLPLPLPLAPMLAKAVEDVPDPSAVAGGYSYEPKWDGFRCLVLKDGDDVELASRGKRPLTRYFPDVVAAVRATLPRRCALDGELVVRVGPPGAQRLSWEAISARIHPAASRVRRLAQETPAEFVAFDLLALGDDALLAAPFGRRRAALEELGARWPAGAGLHVTRVTRDRDEAARWFARFEGAGLDGIVAKPLEAPYQPGKRSMLKVKHKRTAEAVVVGYRVHASGSGIGSLLLGLYDEDGTLRNVGGIGAFTAAARRDMIPLLEPLVVRDADGQVVHAETDRSRFSSSKDVGYVPLRPDLVVEVAFDQLEGTRFRHAVTFLRWRPDREPRSCTLEQIERAPAYDLGAVLVSDEAP